MFIKSLQLINFRNYDELYLDFNKHINLLIGSNGQGKTNILEAIYLLSLGKSFRTNKDKELIKFEKENSYIGGLILKGERDNTIEIVVGKDSKKGVKINKVSIEKFSQFLGNFNVVIFSPEDLKLVKEGPKERRKFIDREISQIIPKYYHYISNYNKILFQRNKLLKSNYIDENLLDVYDEELSNYAAYIYLQRRKFISKIELLSNETHKKMTNGTENLNIKYINQINITSDDDYKELKNKLIESLTKSRDIDKYNKTTKIGPHKDDLEILINGLEVRLYGSQGQQRTCSISLKLSEIELIKEEVGEYPVLLLDDIFSELDEIRQKLLLDNLTNIQIFVTSAEESHKKIFKNKDLSIFNIKRGRAFNY